MTLTLDTFLDFLGEHKLAVLFHLTLLFGLLLWTRRSQAPSSVSVPTSTSAAPAPKPAPSIMSGFAPKEDVKLDPPKDDLISTADLAQCDGETEGRPIYVAIKGTIFDVSAKKDMYGPRAGYHIFAGKDASRALGKSSLKPEDAVSDYTTLTPEETTVLNDWYTYFSKRYNVVGKVAT
ncbi:MAG: hypothetical protein CYPHOPRED_000906 [Cyphobasidiales sp. Tagirdzhanova-0007]|nr:MAG: hypothetical protein CYPHOPRED_000906 [Cyphobasidiales sp. Tagirdzhanova-0007]